MKKLVITGFLYLIITCFVSTVFSKKILTTLDLEDNSEEVQEISEKEIDDDLTYTFHVNILPSIENQNSSNKLVLKFFQQIQKVYQEPETDLLFSPPELNA